VSWYDDDWAHRWPVMSDGTAATEWTLTIPKNWDEFWTKIVDTTNGFDIIVTKGDGDTLLVYDLVGFDHTNRVLTIRWNDLTSGTSHRTFWIYWGKTAPSDLTGSPTIAVLQTALLSLVDPRSVGDNLDIGSERPGSTAPAKEVAKVVSEAKMVWARVPPGLGSTRLHKSSGSDRLLEVVTWSFRVLQAEVDKSLDTAGNNRIVEDLNGDTWLGMYLNLVGWLDDNDYTGEVTVLLGAGPNEPGTQLVTRFLIKARNVSE
jgi:hypothetical protein